METEITKRQSNFELLRIIAMFMIVAGHFAEQGLQLKPVDCSFLEYFIHSFFCSFSRIGVNLFLFIGCYFLVGKKFSFSRILLIYGKMWFYSVTITLLCKFIFRIEIPLKVFIKAFIPFYGGVWWFPNIYILLLLIHPFLNIILNLPKEKIRLLIFILFLLFPIRISIHGFYDYYMDCYTWFIFAYLFIGYYKKYIKINERTKNIFTIYSLFYLFNVDIRKIYKLYGGNSLDNT